MSGGRGTHALNNEVCLTCDDPAVAFNPARARSTNCTRAVVPHMRRRGRGRIAFVSSDAGQAGVAGYAAYSASKFALLGFAQALQMEVMP